MNNKKLITNVNQIILFLNKLCNTSFKISPRIILTAFLINNYTDDVIGHIKTDTLLTILLLIGQKNW